METEKIIDLIEKALENYNQNFCQCRFPRFIQISSINCFDYNSNFKSIETEILIDKSRNFFTTEKVESEGGECYTENWTCKKCGSRFELNWTDLSIYLDRAYLKPIKITSFLIGKNPIKPIPLFRGLVGYNYPPKTEIVNVSFEEFEKYILEL